MLRKEIRFTILFLFLLTSLILSARKIIVVAGDKAFPPFEFVNENGDFVGYNVDVINALAKKLDWKVIFKPMVWVDAKKALKEGKVDIIEGMAYSKERAKIYGFSRPILVNSHGIFVKTDVVGVDSIADLRGYRVAVQKGDIMEEFLKNSGVVLVEVSNQKQALIKLQRDEVIAYIGNNWLFSYVLKELGIDDIKRVGSPMYPTNYCIAVRRGDTELLARINQGLEELEKDGTLKRLKEKWFTRERKKYISPLLLWTAVIVFVLFLIYFLVNNIRAKHSFKKELENTKKELVRERSNSEKLHLVYNLLQLALSSSSEDEVLTNTLETALKVIPAAERGSIIMKDADGKYSFKKFKGYGNSLKKVKFTQRQLLGVRDKTVILTDLEEMDRHLLTPEQFKFIDQAGGFEMTSIIIAPIRTNAESFGQISLESKKKWQFTKEDKYFLSLIADITANFIERSELYGKIEDVKKEGMLLKERFEYIREKFEQINEKMLYRMKGFESTMASINNIRVRSEKDEMGLRKILSSLFLEIGFVKDICLLEYSDNGWLISFNSSTSGYTNAPADIPESVDIETMKGIIEKRIREVPPTLYSDIFLQLLPLSKTVVRISLKESNKAIYMNMLEPLLLFTDSILMAARTISQRKRQYVQGLKNVSYMIDAVDGYPKGNSELVADYAVRLAQKMGMEENRIDTLYFASYVHDIGKLLVDQKILQKPSKLTDEEFAEVKLHPVYGERILEGISPDAAKIVRHHHERYDGSGYPDGYKGNKIPLESRILFLVVSYFAMKNDRPYRKAMTKRKCLGEVYKGRGKEWDPEVVDVFLNEIIRDED